MGSKIAVITARGGSKRIPKKNIRDFLGKPIIAYSIEAALEAGIFTEVMVSTDSEEIAEIARAYGASVPFMRSEKTASDYATTADVLLEVFDEYAKRNQRFAYAACLYPTAPFVTAEILKQAMQMMEENNPVEVMPVVPFSYPPQRCYTIDSQNRLRFKYPEYLMARSQDLERLYHDAGQFYIYHIEKYLEVKGKILEGILPIIVDELRVQDIDNEEDWKVAELKYQKINGQR